MAIELRPFSQLNPEAVQASLTELVQRISEDNPQLDLRRGVFSELLCYYHAVLDTQRRTYTLDLQNARSLQVLAENPELADPDIVDDVLSNYRLDRKVGRRATGEVTVVVTDDVTVTIGQGSVWEARGQQYITRVSSQLKLKQAKYHFPVIVY